MKTALLSLAILILFILVHLGIFKKNIAKARNPVKPLFGLLLPCLIFGCWFGAARLNLGIFNLAEVVIFCFPAGLVYIITYLGLEDDSPSITIVRYVELAETQGRTLMDMEKIITDNDLVLPRLNALVSDGFLKLDNGRYSATIAGKFFNKASLSISRALGIKEAG